MGDRKRSFLISERSTDAAHLTCLPIGVPARSRQSGQTAAMDATQPLQPLAIHTNRLTLRPPCATDSDAFVETQVDPEVRRFLGGPRPEVEVRAAVEAWGLETLSAPGHYVVATTADDAVVGFITLAPRPIDQPGHVAQDGNELELSYVLRRASWGNGYATEAARALLAAAASTLPNQPVIIITQSANAASLRLAERLGFHHLGTFQQFGAEQMLAASELNAHSADR